MSRASWIVWGELVVGLLALPMFLLLRDQRGKEYFRQGEIFLRQGDDYAYQCYQEAAKRNYKRAQCRLNLCGCLGIGVDKPNQVPRCPLHNSNFAICLNSSELQLSNLPSVILSNVCSQGSETVQTAVAGSLAYDEGSPEALDDAVRLYWAASQKGSIRAKDGLISLVENRKGKLKWEDIPLDCAIRAAESGNRDAEIFLGGKVAEGVAEASARNNAWMWLTIAGMNGNPRAQERLGEIIANGGIVIGDEFHHARWLCKAAEQGNQKAQVMVADAFEKGRGVEQSYEVAAQWYRRAAKSGNIGAQAALGRLFVEGVVKPTSSEELKQMVQPLAEQGDARACLLLGVHYYEESAWLEAERWCGKAADKELPEAQFFLGTLYAEGRGVKQSYEEAVRLYHKAAKQGEPMAQAMLGLLYEKGNGVEQSYFNAKQWYQRAAEQGYAMAQRGLGLLYLQGKGVEQSDVEAVRWFRRAAEQGDADAQGLLGLAYLHGRGVPKSRDMAIEWMRKSARNGCENAHKWLDAEGVGMGD